MAHGFVDLPKDAPYTKVSLHDRAGKEFRQVLWGDWLTFAEPEDLTGGLANDAKWQWVRWAWKDPEKRQLLKIRKEFIANERPLEIVFVDVGIGDGAVLISPERNTGPAAPAEQERIIVIDAGKTHHMRAFLDERFKAYRDGFSFHAAIITHCDEDHYGGFGKIFSTAKIGFQHVYHNGLVERNSAKSVSKLGQTEAFGQQTYVTDLVVDDAAMRAVFDPAHGLNLDYAKVIGKAIDNPNVGSFQMLGANIGTAEQGKFWVPGFAPSDGRGYEIEVLGPWVEYPDPADPGRPALRVLGDLGVTKNGHSVILRLTYGGFSILFGGDLNVPAEQLLLQSYGGVPAWPAPGPQRAAMVTQAAKRLRSDVMKTCHHGAADVTDEFLAAVNPAAFVISSGDQDVNYVHPRPDLLGRLGKFGRGGAPVLLSTELQRSTRDIDNRELVAKLIREIGELASCDAGDHAAPEFDSKRKTALKGLLEKFSGLALPSVAVDGAIYVKTDGTWLMAAFKKETSSAKDRWFYYIYHLRDGALALVDRPAKHDH